MWYPCSCCLFSQPYFFVRGFAETNWNLMSTLLVFDPANGLRPEAGDISTTQVKVPPVCVCERASFYLGELSYNYLYRLDWNK